MWKEDIDTQMVEQRAEEIGSKTTSLDATVPMIVSDLDYKPQSIRSGSGFFLQFII